jgi:molecular chaperone DnaK
MSRYCLGIDLGTSFSAVSIVENGKDVKVIENSEGSRTTPSIVAFTNTGELVGQLAKRQAVTNAKNTIFAVKRLIGRRFEESDVQKSIGIMPYSIIKADNGDAWIEINGNKVSPIEISSKILQKMKQTAEDYVGETITDAVITVPAYFNDSQRQATKDAGAIAGLNVLRIINEPTAAALAFGIDKNLTNAKVVVADLGGGTWDLTILEISDGVYEVKSTNGDTFLGGEDFDREIINYLVSEFKKSDGIDLSNDVMALQRLKEAAEKAKIELSSLSQTDVNLPFITADANGPKHLNINITRAKFESLIDPLIQRMLAPCEIALRDAGIDKSEIAEVLAVGGSTRVPLVQKVLEDFFGRKLNKGINPDEVVSQGAALQGAVLKGDVKDVLLLDITPLSLGIETNGRMFTVMIEKNTTIPVKKTQVFSTAVDNQPAITVRIAQGERPLFADNKLLGQFDLEGIPPAPRGVPQLEITYDIDANGILHVSAKDLGTGKNHSISIKSSGGLSDEDIKKLIEEAEVNKEKDLQMKKFYETRNNADGIIYNLRKQIKDNEDKLTPELISEVNGAIDELEVVMKNEQATTEEIQAQIDKIQEISMKIGQEIYKPAEGSATEPPPGADQFADLSPEDRAKVEEMIKAQQAQQQPPQ